jgi:hypothetical protein
MLDERLDLTKKMKANLLRFGKPPHGPATDQVLSVGAAEHLKIRGFIRKVETPEGLGRAKGLYRLTPHGKAALAKL